MKNAFFYMTVPAIWLLGTALCWWICKLRKAQATLIQCLIISGLPLALGGVPLYMKSGRNRCIGFVAGFLLLLPPARAQLYTEKPIPTPSGHPIAATVYTGPSDSVCWIAVADSLISQLFDDETHKTVLYFGPADQEAAQGPPVVLDSSMRHVSVWSGSEFDLYNCVVASGPEGGLAVIWGKQRLFASDIVYPLRLGVPVLQCATRDSGAIKKIFLVDSADHPSAAMSEPTRVHLVFESVAPFPSAAFPYTPYFASFYFVTSRLQYRILHQDGQLDSVANFPGGFRPKLHLDSIGQSHLFWLEGDSSNAPTFRLMYSRNPGTPGAMTAVVYPSIRAVQEQGLNRHPPTFASFLDDSGRVSVGWTEIENSSPEGGIYFARALSGGIWELDTLANVPLWQTEATFKVDQRGNAHVLWQTNDGSNGWTLHYSSSSPSGRLFSHQRTYQSPYPYAGPPVIIVDSRGVANAVFSDGPSGIGYLRDLTAGPDTIIHVSPGSYIAPGIEVSPTLFTQTHSATVDGKDQIWLFRSNSGIALLKFDRTLTGLNDNVPDPALGFSLRQNYPNPFNPSTTIRYDVPERTYVHLAIYDVLGQLVMTLVDGQKDAGAHSALVDAHRLATGVYIFRMQAGSFVQTRKMLLLH